MCFKNRRVRNRTHGGVGGRGRRLPLLPDQSLAILSSFEHSKKGANPCGSQSVLLKYGQYTLFCPVSNITHVAAKDG